MDDSPFRYAGEYYDKETETYYLRARYYDPVIGRFTREDPHWDTGNMIYGDDPLELNNYNYSPSLVAIIQSGNLYVYAMNNPNKYVDPSGCITVAIGGDISAALGLRLGLSGQIVVDDNENVGFAIGGVLGGGMPAASAVGTFTVTNADTIFDLNGTGFAVGGSALVGIDGVVGESQNGVPVYGIQIGKGISTVFPELHGELSKTSVVSLNWLPSSIKNLIFKYIGDVHEGVKLSDKLKEVNVS